MLKLPQHGQSFAHETPSIEGYPAFNHRKVGKKSEEGSSSQQQEVGGAEKSTTPGCSPKPEEHNEDFIEGPSMHTIQKQANASAWGNIRHQLLHAVVEGAASQYLNCVLGVTM